MYHRCTSEMSDRTAYLARVAAVIDELVAAGYVLDEDRELLHKHCAAHFDWLMGRLPTP